jgi:hypothetical protein
VTGSYRHTGAATIDLFLSHLSRNAASFCPHPGSALHLPIHGLLFHRASGCCKGVRVPIMRASGGGKCDVLVARCPLAGMSGLARRVGSRILTPLPSHWMVMVVDEQRACHVMDFVPVDMFSIPGAASLLSGRTVPGAALRSCPHQVHLRLSANRHGHQCQNLSCTLADSGLTAWHLHGLKR